MVRRLTDPFVGLFLALARAPGRALSRPLSLALALTVAPAFAPGTVVCRGIDGCAAVAAHGVGKFQGGAVVVRRRLLAVPHHLAGAPVAAVQVGVGGQVALVVPFDVDTEAVQ